MKTKNRKGKKRSGKFHNTYGSRPTISLCMIVKDEAKHISDCLKSVGHLVDEIIVVDTGSADRTPEIAGSFGAKVYRHPWQDNFSLHRNQSIGYAAGDWILILDADERLECKSGRKLRALVKNAQENAIAVQVNSYIDQKGTRIITNSPRLFRNHPGFHYEGIVHNQPIFEGTCGFSKITIHHYGYLLDEESKKRKAQRTKFLLLKQIQNDHEDPFPYANLIKAHMALGEIKEAFLAGKNAVDLIRRRDIKDSALEEAFVYTSKSLISLKQFNEARLLCEEGISRFGDHPDLYWHMASAAFYQKDYGGFAEAKKGYFRIRENMRTNPELLQHGSYITHNLGWVLNKFEGMLLTERCELPQAKKVLQIALDEKESDRDTLWYLTKVCFDSGLYREAAHAAGRIARCSPSDREPLKKLLLEIQKKDTTAAEFLRVAIDAMDKVAGASEFPPEKQEFPADQPVEVEGIMADNTSVLHKTDNKLTLCMIVRNEERRLPQCLESIKPYVNEIIIVDTGSSDRTIEIAGEYGARIFQHPWEDDFSLHRNQSLSYATGDWILIMDADEVLAPGSGALLRRTIREANPETTHFFCQLIDENHDGSTRSISSACRIFRNKMGFRYQGIVHNRLCQVGKAKSTPIRIIHKGYDLSPEEMSIKFKRTAALLERQLKENPDDIFALFNITQSYCMKGESKEAIIFGEKVRGLLKDAGFQPRYYLNVYYLLAISYLSMGNLEKVAEVCEEGITIEPSYLDLVFLLAYINYRLKQNEKAKTWCLRYMEMLEDRIADLPHPYLIFYRARSKAAVQMLLSLIMLEKGSRDEARRIFREVYGQWEQWLNRSTKEADFPVEAPGLLAEYLLENGDERKALDIAVRVLNRSFVNRECLWQLFRPFFERKLFFPASKILKALASTSPMDLPTIRNIVLDLLPSWPFVARSFYRVLKDYEQPEAIRELEADMIERMGKEFLSLCNAPLVISAAMIAKDEEEFLPACLQSIRQYVDEIIVVDTGSRDHTVEIARSYGARVFFHPWENDFSKHRNQAIRYACGDWILIIDADEELDRGAGIRLRKEVEKNDAETLYLLVRSPLAIGKQLSQQASPRLFRNGMGNHYEGIVHNQLRFKGRVRHTNILLHHKGYNLEKEKMARKMGRTQSLLERQLREKPEDPFAFHNLAVLQFVQEDYDSAIRTARNAISQVYRLHLSDAAYMSTFYLLAASHFMRGEMEHAEQWAKRGMEYDELNLDAACVLCAVMGKKGDDNAIIESARRYLSLYERLSRNPEDFKGAVFHTLGQAGEVAFSMGCALCRQGQREAAMEAFEVAERLAPDGSSIRKRAVSVMLNHEETQGIEPGLTGLKGKQPGDAAYHFRKGLSLFKKGDLKSAKPHLEMALDAGGLHPTICMAMAGIHLNSGDVDGCVEQLNQVFHIISYPITGEIQDIPGLIDILNKLAEMLEKNEFPEAASISLQMADDLDAYCLHPPSALAKA